MRVFVNASLREIKNITEYKEYLFSIFVNILDDIEDGALKEKKEWQGARGRVSPLRLCEDSEDL